MSETTGDEAIPVYLCGSCNRKHGLVKPRCSTRRYRRPACCIMPSNWTVVWSGHSPYKSTGQELNLIRKYKWGPSLCDKPFIRQAAHNTYGLNRSTEQFQWQTRRAIFYFLQQQWEKKFWGGNVETGTAPKEQKKEQKKKKKKIYIMIKKNWNMCPVTYQRLQNRLWMSNAPSVQPRIVILSSTMWHK